MDNLKIGVENAFLLAGVRQNAIDIAQKWINDEYYRRAIARLIDMIIEDSKQAILEDEKSSADNGDNADYKDISKRQKKENSKRKYRILTKEGMEHLSKWQKLLQVNDIHKIIISPDFINLCKWERMPHIVMRIIKYERYANYPKGSINMG